MFTYRHMIETHKPSLVRAIGRWSLTAGIINCVIGSGVFGLPSAVANLVGTWSPLAVLIAGCSIFVIVVCFAEVGSRFEDVGGPYLYAREAFGPAVGFQIGWLQVWTRLLSGAAALNVLIAYLGLLVPAAATPLGRALTMTGSVALVTAINVMGVRNAAWTVNVLTIAKLLPLVLLSVVGTFHLRPEVFATQTVTNPNWSEAILLLVFAYGGFESGVIAASETRNPKGDTAFALIMAMAGVTVIYGFVQLSVVGVLPHAATSSTPIASALREVLGAAGSTIGSVAVIVSVYGWLAGFALMTPRILFAMAERSEMPSSLASVHHRFRTPYAAITANSAVVLALGLYSSFAQAATLGAIARLCVLASTCAALIILRNHSREPAGFKAPCGRAIAVIGVGFCAWLLVTRTFAQVWILLAVVAAGAIIWVGGRMRKSVLFSGLVAIATVVLFPLAPAAQRPASRFDVLIRNGRIVDGTGAPWFRGDVGIVGRPDCRGGCNRECIGDQSKLEVRRQGTSGGGREIAALRVARRNRPRGTPNFGTIANGRA